MVGSGPGETDAVSRVWSGVSAMGRGVVRRAHCALTVHWSWDMQMERYNLSAAWGSVSGFGRAHADSMVAS